jgi:hypothetical protein
MRVQVKQLLAAVLFFSTITPAKADEIDLCIDKLRSAHEQPEKFIQQGDVTCPPGDIVGFPPRLRTENRESVVTYTAPTGKVIRNNSVSSIQIENLSSVNGSIGTPTVSADGSTVSVPISCRGKNVTEGRAWQEIRLSGTMIQLPSQGNLKNWAITCVKCVAANSCP